MPPKDPEMRPTPGGPASPNSSTPAGPDTEVDARPTRRRFTAEYKLAIVREADAARDSGGVGAILRREGLYASHLINWRRQRASGELSAD